MKHSWCLAALTVGIIAFAGSSSPQPVTSAPDLKSDVLPAASPGAYPGEVAHLNGLAVEVLVNACRNFGKSGLWIHGSFQCEGEEFRHRVLFMDGDHGSYDVVAEFGPCYCMDHGPTTFVKIPYIGPPAPSPTPVRVGEPVTLPSLVQTDGKVAEILVAACNELSRLKGISCDEDIVRNADVYVMDGETTYPVYFAWHSVSGVSELTTVVYVKKPLS
jgi:hypothetical protein